MKLRLSLLCVVLGLFALPTFAQRYYLEDTIQPAETGWAESASYNQGQYLDNPCTSWYDAIWVDYSAYVESAQKEAGVDRYTLFESTTMGGTYKAAGAQEADIGYAGAFSIRNYYKVNTSDNFHVVTVVSLDPASRYTSVTVETACGDGSPDSKE
ncbi:MAG TPA: hypothetical protein VF266_03555 [Thermoanaerobaculia bacterium]